jgi:hypothetical protein
MSIAFGKKRRLADTAATGSIEGCEQFWWNYLEQRISGDDGSVR